MKKIFNNSYKLNIEWKKQEIVSYEDDIEIKKEIWVSKNVYNISFNNLFDDVPSCVTCGIEDNFENGIFPDIAGKVDKNGINDFVFKSNRIDLLELPKVVDFTVYAIKGEEKYEYK